jgi:hypothetical protein
MSYDLLPFETTQYLCMSSSFMGLSALTLFYLEQYTFSFFMGILCLTSLNHWRKYEYKGWRQRIDLFWVKVCVVFYWIKLFQKNQEFHYAFSGSLLLCLLFFFAVSESWIKQWVVFHMAIHLYVSFFAPLLFIL